MNRLELPDTIVFTALGVPAPQGSKRGFVVGKRAVLVESSAKVKPWRQAVTWAAREAMAGQPPIQGPVVLSVVFTLPRPTGLSKRKAALGPIRKPDLSKLIRSTEDAMTDAGVWADDARIVAYRDVRKAFAGDPGELDVPGAVVTVEQAYPPERVP